MADWIFSLQNPILFTALVAHKSITKIAKTLILLQKERKKILKETKGTVKVNPKQTYWTPILV